MKKISLILVLLLCIFTATACDKKQESNINATYVGTYSRSAGPMGVILGGHTVVLYNDNTAKIYAGFSSSGMAGSSNEEYSGTYTSNEEDNTLVVNYTTTSSNGDIEEREFEVTVQDTSFAATIWLISSMPSEPITYYEVTPFEITNEEFAYFGVSKDNAGNVGIFVILLYEDENFVAYVTQNEKQHKVTGTFKVLTGGIEESDILELTYGDSTATADYNNQNAFVITLDVEENSQTIRVFKFIGE